MSMVIGIDVGGTNTRALLIDPTSGKILDYEYTPTPDNTMGLLDTMSQTVETLCERHCNLNIPAVGLGIAGLADRAGTIRYSPNLPYLVEFPISRELEKTVGLPVTLGNDATLGALAEAQFGAGRGIDDFALVTLGTGIGTGFVLGGRILWGASGFAGEAGHMIINADGPIHHTGQRGPWEYFASGTALGRMGRDLAMQGRFPTAVDFAGSPEKITGIHVAKAVSLGDKPGLEIFDHFCREVARGVANLVAILDLACVIIGGGLSKIGEPLRAGIQNWTNQLLLGAHYRPDIELELAHLGDHACAFGAALAAATNSAKEL